MEFRVSVCLTKYFNDERSYCYIHIDNSYDFISSLETYLQKLFNIKGQFCLMNTNFYLPSEEKVQIIRPGDTITVVPIQKDWRKSSVEELNRTNTEVNGVCDDLENAICDKLVKKKKKKKSKHEVTELTESITFIEEEPIPIKKDKPAEAEEPTKQNETGSRTGKKKKENIMEVSINSDIEKEPIHSSELLKKDNVSSQHGNESEIESDVNEAEKTLDMQSTLQLLKMKALSLMNDGSAQKPLMGVSGGRVNKRKRIRKRNKKPVSISSPDHNEPNPTTPITFKPMLKSSNHIRFDEEPAVIQNDVSLTEMSTKPRIIHAVENPPTSRSSLSINQNSDNEIILMQEHSYVKSNKAQIANGDSIMCLNVTKNKEPILSVDSVRHRLVEFPVMDSVFPVVKDLVLFKMLKIGKDYTPNLSDFILGNVLEVDKLNGLVKVSVVDGREECLPPNGKFDVQPVDENVSSDEELIIDLAWNQVVEPRLIFP